MLVEKGHLFLNGTKDAGVSRVQTHDEMSLVVVLLHQGTLLLKVHVCAASHHRSPFVTFRQCFGHQRTCIKDEVGFFQHLPSANTHQIGVARSCTHNLNVPLLCS